MAKPWTTPPITVKRIWISFSRYSTLHEASEKKQYKIRAKDINKAAGATLLALAKALGCRMEDLLEYDISEIADNESVD